MIDYYLKFASEEAAEEALLGIGLLVEQTSEEGIYLSANPIASIDYVGIIYKPTGKMIKDKEGMEYPEAKPLEGYHVNIRLIELPEVLQNALLPYIVEPLSPSRVWA